MDATRSGRASGNGGPTRQMAVHPDYALLELSADIGGSDRPDVAMTCVRRAMLLCLPLLLALGGCDPSGSGDAGPDGSAPDAGDALLADTVSSDVPTGDAGPVDAAMIADARADVGTLDAGGDIDAGGASDGGLDGGTAMEDAGSDSGVDAPLDTGIDAPPDTGVDAPLDTGADAPLDAGIDAPRDSGVDAPLDTGVDAPRDSGVDAPTDSATDAPPDSGVDAPSTDAGPAGPTLLDSRASLPAIKSVSVTADGSRIVVGMPDHTYRTRNYAGSARIYRREGAVWVFEQELGLGFADFETFGTSVAISGDGNRLAVARAPTGTTRYVHIYQRTGTVWTQTQVLSDGDAFNGYATALAISYDGYTLAVPRRAIAPTGQVLIYRGDASRSMSLRATLVPANSVPTSFYQFGGSVSMSADASVIVVGAPMESSTATGVNGDWSSDAAGQSGAAYIFEASGIDTWSQVAYLKASNTGAFDQFGAAIAVSGDGNTVAVGAIHEDSAATGIDGDGSSNAADGAGAVYVFGRSAGTWSFRTYIKASNTAVNGSFGRALTLSGDGSLLGVLGSRIAMGGNDAYVFRRMGTWSERYYLPTPLGTLGAAMSESGNVFVIGIAAPPGRDMGGEYRVYATP